MRSKILSIRKPLCFLSSRKYCNKPVLGPRCEAHMNELPVPCLPWEPWYRQKQSWYNTFLFGATCWWLFSFGMMLYTDSMFLNWAPPKQPGPPSDMVEECVEAN